MTKHKNLFIAIAGIVVGSALFLGTIVNAFFYHPSEKELTNAGSSFSAYRSGEKTVSQNPLAKPVRLTIPAIGVDADVQDVGIANSGNVMVPNNYTDVGWYRYGPVPGQTGSAIIDGHVNNGFGTSGVFGHLKELKAGDDIYVTYADQTTLHFRVEQVELYLLDDAPKEKIFNQTDKARLNLITCDGEWLPDRRTDDHRLVVYSVLE